VTWAVTGTAVVAWLRAYAEAIARDRDYLTDLDSAIGDADHGSNMDRGMKAVAVKLESLPQDDMGALLKAVGMTLVSTVGGAGGPLYGTLFLQMGASAGPATQLTFVQLASALEAGVRGVQARGKAEPGDKTMIDALLPAAEALRAGAAADVPPADALRLAAEAARRGMNATIPLVARKGRASYLGERSAGHQDPGATSSWLLLEAAAELAGDCRGPEPGAGAESTAR
jgi:phosphoenolpyruvate---glycerone phosphotransferase subunit DhaL